MPKPKKSTVATLDPRLDALGATALVKEAKADKHRDMLAVGAHAIDLKISGQIDGENWKHAVCGTLIVAADSEAAGTTPYGELLHSALCLIGEPTRRRWLAEVAEGRIPPPDCSAEKAAAVAAEWEPAAAGYRAAHPQRRRGNVTFASAAV